MDILTIALFWLALSVVVGVAASSKQRSGFGWFLLALLISPLLAGLFVLALPKIEIDTEGRLPCPFCAEKILPAAKVCPNCQRDIERSWPAKTPAVIKIKKLSALWGSSEPYTYWFNATEYPNAQEANLAREEYIAVIKSQNNQS